MKGTVVALAVALPVAGSGCMAGMAAYEAPAPSAQAATEPASGGMAGGMMQMCPMAVPGTQVAAADTADGEAITFTTAPGRVTELRSRIHAMADMHNRHHQGPDADHMHGEMQRGDGMMGGAMMGGSMESSGGMGMSMMPPPSKAAAEDVEGGSPPPRDAERSRGPRQAARRRPYARPVHARDRAVRHGPAGQESAFAPSRAAANHAARHGRSP